MEVEETGRKNGSEKIWKVKYHNKFNGNQVECSNKMGRVQ